MLIHWPTLILQRVYCLERYLCRQVWTEAGHAVMKIEVRERG